MKNRDVLLAFVFITIGFIYRLIPVHIPNFTPVAAMALVGGMYMGRKSLALLVPVAALYLSDIILNNYVFKAAFTGETGFILWADYMYFTYGAMLIAVVIGMFLAKKSVGSKILVGGLLSSLTFYAFADFGSWLTLPMYPKTIAGLMASYVNGFPFFLATLLGNIVFAAIFIGCIEYMKQSKEASFGNQVA